MVSIEILFQNEYFYFVIIIGVFIIIAKIFHFILTKYLKKIAEKTKSHFDDVMLHAITKPLYISIILVGIYLGLKSLTVLTYYALWINKIFFVVFIFLAALIIVDILSVLVSHWLKVQKKFEKTPQVITKIVAVFIYLIALLIILGHFNVEVTALVATLGIGALAIGLALQGTLSNFFSGLHLISDRPINVGDYIEIEGNISGYVEDIGWRSTRVRTLPNTIVIVPNAKLAESTIINTSLPVQEMSVVIQCGVAYGSDLDKVEKVTIEVAKKVQNVVPGAVKNFEPFIRYHTFGDSNINFSIILRVEKAVNKYPITHEFIKALKKRYDKEKIEISWPVRKIYKGK